jgi:hypothetical protein
MNDLSTHRGRLGPPLVGRSAGRSTRLVALLVAVTTAVALIGLAPPPGYAAPNLSSPDATAPQEAAVPAPAPQDPPQPANLTPLSSNGAPTAAQQRSLASAAAKAVASGHAVTVEALTTETQMVTAQPSGGLALSATPVPVRTKKSGSWTPIDTKLRRNADGTWSPTATAYGTLRVSNGGTGPLAVTSSGRVSYRISWPGRLPTPSVSGSAATYKNVMPGVDLVVSATATGGLSETLVVANAAAARSSSLRNLTLSTTVIGGRQHAGRAADAVAVTGASDGSQLESATPLMWDSSTVAPAELAHRAQVAPDRSDVTHPGLAAHVGKVHTTVSANSLKLAPDTSMLDSASTVFPVFIDPTLNWHEQDAAAPNFDEIKSGSPCNGASYWNNTGAAGDYGYLGVGWQGWPGGCNGIERAMYQWKIPSIVWGSTVSSASVNATEVYAAQCSTTSTIDLHETGGIGSGTDWNNRPSYTGGLKVGVSFAPAAHPTYCPGNSNVTHGFTVTERMKVAAAQHWSQWTIALANDNDESSHNRNGFKRFAHNPTLAVFFDRSPATPSAAAMAAKASSTNAGCATSSPYPVIGKTITSNPPTLNTTVTDPDGDKTQATFKYWVDGASTSATGLSGDNLSNNSTASYSLPASFVSTLSNGQIVDWQVQVSDGLAASAWSTVCHFAVQPTGPDAPVIQPNSTYPDTSDGGATGAIAGTPATWEVVGATTGAPAAKFVYGLDQPPAASNPPAAQVLPTTGTAASTPGGRWLLNEGTGTSLADTSGGNHPATASNTGWATDTTRGKVASFNGTTAYAATTGPVLTTNQSFTVAAWAMLTDNKARRAVISQDGTTANGFNLEYDTGCNCWQFAIPGTDTASPTQTLAKGPAPTLNVWTHLVGVYNATAGTMSIYTNGVLAASVAVPSRTWSAGGNLTIGRTKWSGANSDWFLGNISDAQVYARALTTADVMAMYSHVALTTTPFAPGPHTLYVHGVDVAGNVSADDAYPFIAGSTPNTACASLAACFNNTAISPDNNAALGNADGAGNSYSATDLANAGWNSGGKVTINGAPFTLPTFGTGQPDNVLAANQTVTYNYPVPGTGLSALQVLTFSSYPKTFDPGAIPGHMAAPYVPSGTAVTGQYCFDSTNPSSYCQSFGTITYTDGSSSTYDLTVPDWWYGPSALAAVSLSHVNKPSGQQAFPVKIFAFSIPLQAGKTVQSVTLPDVGSGVANNTPALHILGMSARNTTTGTVTSNGSTTAAPAGQNWTGAWANPTEGQFGWSGFTFSNLSIRTRFTPSISGSTIRVKLDNALSANPLVIGHATVSSADHSRMTNLTFSGAGGITLPAGGMTYSDPLPFTVTAGQQLLASYSLTNSLSYLPMNTGSDGTFTYVSAAGSGDHAADTTDTAFTVGGTHTGYYTHVLTNVDVTTSGTATQAVLGDELTDKWRPNSRADTSSFRTNLAADIASTASPYGILSESVESNKIMGDQSGDGGPAALSRIDRDILDLPNITSVILYEGLEDLLRGQTADALTADGYTQLLTYLQGNQLAVIANGLTPCDGYVGDGSTSNDPCTATVDGYRTATNTWLANNPLGMGPWSTPPLFYTDADAAVGTPDTSNGETKLTTQADKTDHLNLTCAGYGALASAYLGPQDTWQLGDGVNPTDGSVDQTVTTAADTASNANNPYLLSSPTVGQNPAALTGGASWTNDPSRGGVLTLDGGTGRAETSGAVLDTTASFSVSAWVKLSSIPTYNATIAAQDGVVNSAFYLQYNITNGSPSWSFSMPQSDGAGGQWRTAIAPGATTGWTHLVGVYNAVSHDLELYVNGVLSAISTGSTGWASAGAFTIGRGRYDGSPTDYLPGSVSDVRAWNYAMAEGQAAALYGGETPCGPGRITTPRSDSSRIKADFNGDGRSDVAFIDDDYIGRIFLWTMTARSDGSFAAPELRWQSTWGPGIRNLTAGDFNFDGKADLALFYDYGDGHVSLFTLTANSNGDGGISPPTLRWDGPSWGTATRYLAGADYDGDGRTDIALVNDSGDGRLTLYTLTAHANGDGGFAAPVSRWTDPAWGTGTKFVSAGDFNGDGRADLALLYDYGNNHVKLSTLSANSSGDGGFANPVARWDSTTWGPGTKFVSAGDYNGDGKTDLSLFFDYGGNHVAVWTMTANANYDGGLAAPTRRWDSTTWGPGTKFVSAGDYNGDGKTDLSLFFDYSGGHVALWTMTANTIGDGGLAAPTNRWDNSSWGSATRLMS